MLCLLVFFLSSLHHPDRKVMHEATKEKRSGESASSHQESITRVIRDLHCLNYGTRGHCSSSALRLASGAEKPFFAAIVLVTHIPSPSFNFGCLRTECTPRGAFTGKRLEAKFLGGFFRLKSEAGVFSNRCTHADD